LQGVAAGDRDVVLLHARYGSASHRKQSVDVIALQTVDGPNFIQEPPQGPPLLDFGLVIINTGGQLIWKLANPDALATTVTSIAIAGPERVRFQVGTLSAFPIPVGSAGLDVPVTLDASSTGSFSADLSVQGTAE